MPIFAQTLTFIKVNTRLSANIRWARFLFAVLAIVLLGALIYNLVGQKEDANGITALCIFIGIFALLYFLFDRAKTLTFDTDFLYIKSQKEEVKVPLEKVLRIKMTMTQINNMNLWKIVYKDDNGLDKSTRFLPRIFSTTLEEFKINTKKKNPSVKIKNWSHSFDFDQ